MPLGATAASPFPWKVLCYNAAVHLTPMGRLQPTSEQSATLLGRMKRFNAVCHAIAEVAFCEWTANKIQFQKLVHGDVRERFGVSAWHGPWGS